MTLAEVQKEVAGWDDDDRRKLMAFLATLAFQQEGIGASELARRAGDTREENWVSLEQARQRLSELS